jgi:hypothetical protein
VIGDKKEEFLVYEGQEVRADVSLSSHLCSSNQAVSGTVEIVTGGKKVEHLGVKIELIGLIGQLLCLSLCPLPLTSSPPSELYYDRGNAVKFNTLVRELEPAGILTDTKVSLLSSLSLSDAPATFSPIPLSSAQRSPMSLILESMFDCGILSV